MATRTEVQCVSKLKPSTFCHFAQIMSGALVMAFKLQLNIIHWLQCAHAVQKLNLLRWRTLLI